MSEILKNCAKMECFLNGDYKALWRMENEEVKNLREKLELVPVETARQRSETEDTYDDMPPLIDEDFPIPSCLITPSSISKDNSVVENETNEEAIAPPYEYRPQSPPLFLKTTTYWPWQSIHTPISPTIYTPQVRDL